ncbi:MAG: PH domain-containing protein [Saprospiraceae bacterium]|nr:PH domain-containing protein [Saprospiraceae bacterium]
MRKYENFQWNWLLIIGLTIVVFQLSLKLNDADNPPLPFLVSMLIQILLVLVPLMFYGLRTTINDDLITLKYGIGIITIKLKLSDIQSVKVVRNPWYYGIGIRLIPGGILYNAHGFKAVELRFTNKKYKVRIGTSEPEILEYEIAKRLI